MRLSVADVATRTGMSEAWVRDHAEDLGGTKDGKSWSFVEGEVDLRANHLRIVAARDDGKTA